MVKTARDSKALTRENHELARHSRRALLRAAGAGTLTLAAGARLGSSVSAARTSTPPARMMGQSENGITTFPRPDSRTASPFTEITFRGVTSASLGTVTVVGSQSGANSGLLMAHADGHGVSFVPDSHFEAGEQVTVTADLDVGPASGGSLVFEVARPARQRRAPSDVVTDDPAVPPQTFRSRPDLRPPVMEITVPADGTADGLIFLGTRMRGGQAGATVIDDMGELVWFSPPDNHLNAHYDVRVQEYRGEPVVTFAEANAEGPVGWRRGHYVICNTAYERIAEFQIGNGLPGGDHHEFQLTADGTALVGAYHPIQWDLSPFGGAQEGTAVDNVVQEIEIETGRVLFEWHSLDHISIDESYSGVPEAADRQYDYLHMNSIAVAPDGDLIINARHTFAVYKLDRSTGDIIWRLNGKRSDFEMGDGTKFAYSHDAQLHERGKLTVFDNATSGPTTDVDSRGLVLRLDEEAMTATLAGEYHHPDGIVSVSQANVQTLPNGNVFIGWGSAPVFSEFTSDGELIFNGRFPRGGSSYRAYRFPWVAIPAEPPAIAVETADNRAMTVYMSWNGATEVATWRVMGGASATGLAEIASSERKGFETVIEVETDAAYVAAEALNEAGEVIGVSEAAQSGT